MSHFKKKNCEVFNQKTNALKELGRPFYFAVFKIIIINKFNKCSGNILKKLLLTPETHCFFFN